MAISKSGTQSLSVVIPTLGRPALGHALGALAAQVDSEPFTVIVVHGPEVAADVIRAQMVATLATQFETVLVKELSVGARRNAGATASTSPWIAFTDDDCRVPPRWIAHLTRFCRERPNIDIAGGTVIEPIRRALIYSFMRRINYMANSSTMKVRPGGIPSLGAANLLIRRKAFEQLGGFDPGLASTEDYELLVRAQQAGLRIGTYFDDPPVEHWHTTDFQTFLRRYRGYGQGVAQTVLRHGLDASGHRLDLGGRRRPLRRLRSVFRFACEDLRQHRPLPGDTRWARCGAHALLAVLRAHAFQQGALEVLTHARDNH